MRNRQAALHSAMFNYTPGRGRRGNRKLPQEEARVALQCGVGNRRMGPGPADQGGQPGEGEGWRAWKEQWSFPLWKENR